MQRAVGGREEGEQVCGGTWDLLDPAQLREACRGIAADKVSAGGALTDCTVLNDLPQPYVTELDLRVASLPASAIEFLRQTMPSAQNDAGESEYNYERWIEEVFEQEGQ